MATGSYSHAQTSTPVEVTVRKAAFAELLEGPPSRETRDAWLQEMKKWRDTQRQLFRKADNGFSDPYALPDLKWSQRNFIHVLTMAHDQYLYDPVSQRYTVGRYL